ncbi:hypothetical protein PAECIP111802_05670 [Paenibacillus allorhizosphaerae]|uniref:Uncharacterized protein n=1 Tax=Paenibacillus allorhizosphaerae TaxID=2849866 RepID=A0ABM8VQE5_9BACL|nr:hypothetical protein PAECIP111802_05670 [Paenibacillus allorhizosphaerae]
MEYAGTLRIPCLFLFRTRVKAWNGQEGMNQKTRIPISKTYRALIPELW